jgi:hypothetical protein
VTEFAGTHYTTQVSSRARLTLLLVLIGAIVYVLISPLPELAATSNLKFPVFALAVVIFFLNLPAGEPRSAALFRYILFLDRDNLLVLTCVLLC